jgi:hypothetical protein
MGRLQSRRPLKASRAVRNQVWFRVWGTRAAFETSLRVTLNTRPPAESRPPLLTW